MHLDARLAPAASQFHARLVAVVLLVWPPRATGGGWRAYDDDELK